MAIHFGIQGFTRVRSWDGKRLWRREMAESTLIEKAEETMRKKEGKREGKKSKSNLIIPLSKLVPAASNMCPIFSRAC